MTQTPIQELLEEFETAKEFFEPQGNKEVVEFIAKSIERIKSKLPKEREVMEGLWDDAQTDAETKQKGFEGYKSFDDYYNATFHYQQFEKK